MTPLPPSPDPADADGSRDGVGDAADVVVRRAPFSDNPRVGARGQRTQQRILDAALEVFAEDGYQHCRIDRITSRAGCSRAAFYQYFSSKEELFTQLTGVVARQLNASADALGAVTGDAAGWAELRDWVRRYGEVFARYEPVFRSFDVASESNAAVATGSVRWAEHNLARIRRRIDGSSLPPRRLTPVLDLLVACAMQTHHIANLLERASPGGFPEARIGDALSDVMHRTLFGRLTSVNEHARSGSHPPALRFDPLMGRAFQHAGAGAGASADDGGRTGRTAQRLMDAGRRIFAERGYHDTRVDDVVEAAGLSHGVFYRYFENKEQLARLLTAQAVQAVSVVLADIPVEAATDPSRARPELRRWLGRYNATQVDEAVMARIWSEAALQDATLDANTASAFDWGRRKLVAFLEPRGFGDVDMEAVVMVAFLSVFGARARTDAEIDAAALVIERGLLGL